MGTGPSNGKVKVSKLFFNRAAYFTLTEASPSSIKFLLLNLELLRIEYCVNFSSSHLHPFLSTTNHQNLHHILIDCYFSQPWIKSSSCTQVIIFLSLSRFFADINTVVVLSKDSTIVPAHSSEFLLAFVCLLPVFCNLWRIKV